MYNGRKIITNTRCNTDIFNTEGNEVTTEFYSENQIVFEVGSFFQKTTSKENYQTPENYLAGILLLNCCSGYFTPCQSLGNLAGLYL